MKRILHIDRDEEMLAIVRHVLGKNYSLVSTTDAAAAATALEKFQPDLVITDIIEEIVQPESLLLSCIFRQHVPVLLFSAIPDLSAQAAALRISNCLEKPTSISMIRHEVSRIIQAQ